MTDVIAVGQEAPDFTLKDQEGKETKLSDYRGKKILLSFHPLAFTGVCAEQMKDLEESREEIEKAGAVAFGVSVDSNFSKKEWAKNLGISETKLLADFWPHGGTAQEYGLFMEDKGISNRAVVVIDEKGKVRWLKVYETSEKPDISEVLEQLK